MDYGLGIPPKRYAAGTRGPVSASTPGAAGAYAAVMHVRLPDVASTMVERLARMGLASLRGTSLAAHNAHPDDQRRCPPLVPAVRDVLRGLDPLKPAVPVLGGRGHEGPLGHRLAVEGAHVFVPIAAQSMADSPIFDEELLSNT